MGSVIASAVVSLDGFIADPDDGVGPLFDWYHNGPVEVYGTDQSRPFHVSQASADYLNDTWPNVRVCIIGRRLFDLTNGWHGVPAVGDHVIVVTHQPPTDWPFPDAPFTFATSIEEAVTQARHRAGDGDISITGGNLTGQALTAGLVDEIAYNLAPVLLGAGRRFFDTYTGPQRLLDNPRVVQGNRVTHLHYRLS
ncbi:dihydrofolate reductase [Kribbella sandramycini]|uniref:Dihydrofolate reductase n=1 Tax=Kribbella sandramycini TaxID=60450 RepID=A0A7Y4NZM0_9ACTN|nr:dihydrofolate reductase family protein [Kribbella sandramycini]MBB6564493.1 dihydrofolate reductase [Kribbella sandramycini]NOL42197.1 dihydrofolate reductase [Kribbella sandramycini]